MEKLIKYSLGSVFAFLLAACPMSGQVLAPPVFNCIQVAANGDATLNWTIPNDPGNYFTQYEIFTAQYPGDLYASIGSVPFYGVNSFVQNTTVTLSNNYYYYLQTWSQDGSGTYTSINSDTLTNIYLEALPAQNAAPNTDSSAYLNWNSPFLNEDNLPFGLEYEVWKEQPLNNWTMVQTLPLGVSSWIYIVDFCPADTLNFQIRLNMPNGCQYVSNISGNNFVDKTFPEIPIITDISINAVSNDAEMHWLPNEDLDTEGYLIYECEDGLTTTLLDYVLGINTTQFTDVFSNTILGPVSYGIAAVDVCGNRTPGVCATSFFLQVPTYVTCNEYVAMNWTPYDSWEDEVDFYIIYHAFSTDNNFSDNAFVPIDTIYGFTNLLNYADFYFGLNGYNGYQIEAVSTVTGYRAKSNVAATFVSYPVPPDYVYLASASVISADSTIVTIEIDPTLLTFNYSLQRYDESGEDWDDVITLEADNSATLSFIDNNLTTDVFSYTYRVITENICNTIIDTTNLGKTILTDGLANQQGYSNTIVWSPYQDWENGVSVYRIYRSVGKLGVEEMIAEINSNASHFYVDDVSELYNTEGEFCYRVEAVENPSTLLGISHSSFSNQLCLSLEPVIWIPNSFVVDGVNRTFAPVISFANISDYLMIIYSRWGDVIFESKDIMDVWDGKMNGKTVQEGSYTYFMSVKDGKGRAFERTGYVVMLVDKEK